MKTSDARIKELERKLGASCLEELVLKKSLSEAHAESERLSATAEVLHRKYQAATSGENLVKLVVVDHKRTINFFTNGSVQDRGVGAGMMLSPQRESGSQKADLGALGGEHMGCKP